MEESIQVVHREHENERGKYDSLFTEKNAEAARRFHQTIPGYKATPLVGLNNLAEELGLGVLYVKDESFRFGLNAFKALGGSWCIANIIGEKLGLQPDEITFLRLQESDAQSMLKSQTFVTATDGNHGRGVAWTAHMLGAKSKVFMPKGSAPERLHNIQALGADASITEWNYDDTVRYARKTAEEHGWMLIQDTAWPRYEKIPAKIMQGYLTMALEAFSNLPEPPTHIFLQAGVGSMAAAVAAFAANYYGESTVRAKGNPEAEKLTKSLSGAAAGKARPEIIIVEPDKADCIFRTAQADDGHLHKVSGALNSIMAGLSCGEPSTIAWEELRAHADYFVSMPDYVAAEGMRILGSPLQGDTRIVSGESGASTLGLVAELLRNPRLNSLREQLHLDKNSCVLCFSTEGDTDAENYRRIVWDGLYPSAL